MVSSSFEQPVALMCGFSYLLFFAAIFVVTFLAPLLLEQLEYGVLGYVVLGFNLLAAGIGHYLAEQLVLKYNSFKALLASTAVNLIYVGIYIFPVSCGTEHTNGACNKSFIGILILLFGFVSSFAIPIVWAAHKEYFNEDTGEETHQNTFSSVYYFHGILGTVIAILLLNSSRVRIALYIILTLVVANSGVIQFFFPTPSNILNAEERSQASGFLKAGYNRFRTAITTVRTKKYIIELVWAIYQGFELAYCMSVLPYLAAESLLKQKETVTGDHILESELKAGVAMLGLAIGKCITSEVYEKIATNIQKRPLHHFEFGIFSFVLVIALIILYADMETYNTGWFFVALLWGIQDSILAYKQKALEKEENIVEREIMQDAHNLLMTLAGFLMYLLAAALHTYTPIILLVILIAGLGGLYVLPIVLYEKKLVKEMEAEDKDTIMIAAGADLLGNEGKKEGIDIVPTMEDPVVP